MTLDQIMQEIEFCSAQLHDADGDKIAKIKTHLLELQEQLKLLETTVC